MKGTSSKVSSFESRPGQSSLGTSFKSNLTTTNTNHNMNNGGEGASKINTNSNCDTEVEAEDTMIVKREGVLVTDLLYRLHRRSTKLVDTHVICMDGYIPVHRCVLMACSKFLMNLLIQEDPAELAAICLPDFKVSQVIPLINSFYTGCTIFNKSDLNTTLELISVLRTDTAYNFQLAKDQDKKWSPKMRHYLENKEVNSEIQSTPGGSSSKQKVLEKPSLEASDGDKSNQSFLDDLSPHSVENGATIEVDIEEIDDPEYPADANEESDDDIKILEILSAEPVISDVTEVADISFAKSTGVVKSNISNVVVQMDDESSNEPYDEYVFSPTDVDLATNVIVRQSANPTLEDDDDDDDKDPLELESLVFDKDFVEVHEDFHGRSYEFETIAFDESGQHKQIAQILTEPVPLTHSRTDFAKTPRRKTTPKAKKSRARGRKKISQLKSLLTCSSDPPTLLLFEENILGSATPPHLRRKSFEKLEEQKSRMEDIRFSNQLQKRLQMSLEAVIPASSTATSINEKDCLQLKSTKRSSIDEIIQPQQDKLQWVDELRQQGVKQGRGQREEEEALLKKFEQDKRQRDEEKRLREEEDSRLSERRRLKEDEEQRRLDLKLKEELSEEKQREDRLRKEDEHRRKDKEEKRIHEQRLKMEETMRKALEEENRKKAAEETRIQIEKAKRKAEEARSTAEKEKRLRTEEEKLKFEEERLLKLEEDKRIKAEEDKRMKAEEENRKKIQDERRIKEEERRHKEEALLKKSEEEKVHQEQEEGLQNRSRDEKIVADEDALRKQKREDQKRKEAEERRLKEERRRGKEARRKREEDKRIEADERFKHLETDKCQQAENEREEDENRRQKDAVRVAIQKAEEALNEQIELERKRREAEEARLEEVRKFEEEENRKLREETELIEAEKRERERIEEEKRIEDELEMQIEKDMQKFDYEPSILGMQEPKRRTEEAPAQQPKSTPFFEEFVKKKQKILEEEKRKRQAEEQQQKGEEAQIKSKLTKTISECTPKIEPVPKLSRENVLKIFEENKSKICPEKQLKASETKSENQTKVTSDTRAKSSKSLDAERVQEQLKSINLSVEVEEIVGISSHSRIMNDDSPKIMPQFNEAQLGITSERLHNIGLNLSIIEETNSANQHVYEFVDDIPVAETEIELTGDGFAAETELEIETAPEIDVEASGEADSQESPSIPAEVADVEDAGESGATIEPDVEQSSEAIAETTSVADPPSPFIGEDLSLTSSSPENGLHIVEAPETPKPKFRIKKKKSRKVREKQTQVKPQMIAVSKKPDSVIIRTTEQSRRSSRSSESSRASRRSPEPISLNAAARFLIKDPKKPIRVQHGSKRITLQNPKIIISRLSNEEYKHYSFRLQRFKRMRTKQGTPPPTLTLASPEAPSTSKAMSHWKALQKDVTSSRSKSIRKRDSVDDGPPPLLEPQLPSSSKHKRSGVTPVGIENFPTVSQPACITVNDLDWYQKELKRCAHCKKKYVTHTKASSCLLNHGFRRCLICLDLVSSLDTSYELHYSKHHSVPKHRGHVACPICGKLFLYRGLQSHVTRKHLQPHEPQDHTKTPEFHSQNLPHHFFYPPPPQEQLYNQFHKNSLYQHHQYQASNSSQKIVSINEPPVEPLVLDLKKIQNHSGIKERPENLPVRLSESEDENHSDMETETLDGSDDGKPKDGKVNSVQTGFTGSVLKDTNKEGFRNDSSSEVLYAFKESNREIPIELIPNPTTAFVDAELARRAFQQHFQVEKIAQSQPAEQPATPVSQLTIEKTPIVSERERELPLQPQPQKRSYQDCVDMMQPRKKFFPYNEPYQYEAHHRNNDDNLHLPRLPYFPLPSAPSHIPNHHHHDFFQHRPMGMHNPPYPQSHHPHMHAHLPQHQQPSSHSSLASHSMSSHMDNEFPIINPGITVDESSGSVLCELMPVNYHASPIPLQQPYNSNGPKGPSAVPAPLQDLYEPGNSVGINRPAPSIFSTPPLSSTPSSTSSNSEWTPEDTSRRHHQISHHSSHHQNLQSHHHHHQQHQQWGEPMSTHRNESVISVNMEYMKIAEMDHQHHQQHPQHSDGPVQCDRCKASFYNQEHLASHRCIYDMN
ncbi:unnamed protein product [Allacma fusca]|uniref:BTB domain-containing protein n=1 Tax=Allacma fusca TaxID=39272 RepID=A0A8J2JS45_9HEXA|nr:unnamed protein product [Allacma fusca]